MDLRIISSNIRFENPADKEHNWPNRKSVLANNLNNFTPQIIGTQEGREPQLREFESLFENLILLDQHRMWITERMYPTLLIDQKRLEVIHSGDIWLSKTPDVPGSSSFESAFPRLATWFIGMDLKRESKIFVVNVHLDHILEKTRVKQSQVLMQQIQKINLENLPLILMGDFNAAPDSDVRKTIIQAAPHLYDPWIKIGHDEEASHHQFTGSNPDGTRIDWLLLDQRLECLELFLDKGHEEKIYPSDHFPLKGVIKTAP